MTKTIFSTAIVVALLALTTPSKSNDVPKRTIDMTLILKDDGKVLPDGFGVDPRLNPDCKDCPPLTLGLVIKHALINPPPQPDGKPAQLGDEVKFSRGYWAEKLVNDPTASLDSKQITLIKQLVGYWYPPKMLAIVFPLLDPTAPEPALQ